MSETEKQEDIYDTVSDDAKALADNDRKVSDHEIAAVIGALPEIEIIDLTKRLKSADDRIYLRHPTTKKPIAIGKADLDRRQELHRLAVDDDSYQLNSRAREGDTPAAADGNSRGLQHHHASVDSECNYEEIQEYHNARTATLPMPTQNAPQETEVAVVKRPVPPAKPTKTPKVDADAAPKAEADANSAPKADADVIPKADVIKRLDETVPESYYDDAAVVERHQTINRTDSDEFLDSDITRHLRLPGRTVASSDTIRQHKTSAEVIELPTLRGDDRRLHSRLWSLLQGRRRPIYICLIILVVLLLIAIALVIGLMIGLNQTSTSTSVSATANRSTTVTSVTTQGPTTNVPQHPNVTVQHQSQLVLLSNPSSEPCCSQASFAYDGSATFPVVLSQMTQSGVQIVQISDDNKRQNKVVSIGKSLLDIKFIQAAKMDKSKSTCKLYSVNGCTTKCSIESVTFQCTAKNQTGHRILAVSYSPHGIQRQDVYDTPCGLYQVADDVKQAYFCEKDTNPGISKTPYPREQFFFSRDVAAGTLDESLQSSDMAVVNLLKPTFLNCSTDGTCQVLALFAPTADEIMALVRGGAGEYDIVTAKPDGSSQSSVRLSSETQFNETSSVDYQITKWNHWWVVVEAGATTSMVHLFNEDWRKLTSKLLMGSSSTNDHTLVSTVANRNRVFQSWQRNDDKNNSRQYIVESFEYMLQQ